jgi:pimeloyl-ACP methyl ester carboxylesterase
MGTSDNDDASSVYAQEFADRIANSRVEILEGVGHVPQWEQLEKTSSLALDFLNGSR